jgi:hypothetical protein
MFTGRQSTSSITNLSPRENAHGPDNLPLRQQISHLKRMFMGLTTHLFDKKYFGYNTEYPFTIFSLQIR